MSIHGPTYIYSGEGAWNVSVEQIQKMLEKVIDPRSIKQVESLSVVNKDTKLVVIPGGQSSAMSIFRDSKLISEYVHKGGSLLGICAGGIRASKGLIAKPNRESVFKDEEIKSLFQQGKLYRKDKDRDQGYIQLYSAKCVAPHIVKNVDPSHPENICAVDVFTSDDTNTFKAFHYSGPVFLEAPTNAKVLLRYKDPVDLIEVDGTYDSSISAMVQGMTGKTLKISDPIAALSIKCGFGQAVLTGIHPEMDPDTFSTTAKKYAFEKDIPAELSQDDSNRQALVNQIFAELKL